MSIMGGIRLHLDLWTEFGFQKRRIPLRLLAEVESVNH